ncbi:MAG: EFR1 family ferrodoxin [Clostridiales bacterium]|nr:EFR1 family ferrodoxin [Clostridiales bacterium]
MRLVLFYFSGTGNTRYIAHHLCNRLNESGYTAKAVSIEGINFTDAQELIDNASAVGLAWPIYGSDLPNNMKQFIKAMPVVENKPLLTFCTQMLFSGDGAVVMRHELEKKGYVQKWALQFNMPNNYVAAGVPLKSSADYALHEEKYLKTARKKIDILADSIIKKKDHIKQATIFNTLLAMSQRPFYKYIGHNMVTKMFGVNDQCTGCKLCAQMCPMNVIKMEDDKAVYVNQEKCLACFRCSNFCPVSAITVLNKVKQPHYKGPDEETYKAIITNRKA